MKRGWLLLALCGGCAPDTVMWLRVEAPLVVPDACDDVRVNVSRPDGTPAFSHDYDLSQGPPFPLTLSLTAIDADVGVPLSVKVDALKSGALARPWATQTVPTTLAKAQLTQVLVKLCQCP